MSSMTSKANPTLLRQRSASTTNLMRHHPLLLIVTICLVFASPPRQGHCVAGAFATGGGGVASFAVASSRARRRSIEPLGNIPPSLTTQKTAISRLSSTPASYNYHQITYRNHHRNKSTTIMMNSNQQQEQQVQQRLEMISSISSPTILDNYDTFLLDMWGVMHNGKEPYDGVIQAIQGLKKAGKKLIILSNSSKRRENSEEMLIKLGFDPADFHNIITSGDISHNLLQGEAEFASGNDWQVFADKQGQRKVFVFGSGDDDEEYCTSAGLTLSSIDDADLILSRGTFTINDGSSVISKTEDEAEYWRVMEESMMKAARRKLPMLVSNPDKVRPGASPPPPMPGAIGDAYERFVWTTHCHPVGDMTEESAREYVKRIGKPFLEVYDIALKCSDGDSSVDRSRAIMIGDALETDAVGGHSAGIDVLWVTQDGIHGKDVEEKGADAVLTNFNGMSDFTYAYGKEVMPRYSTNHFRW